MGVKECLQQLLPLCTITLLIVVQTSHADNHDCVNGNTVSIQLDDYYYKDETIRPQLPNEPTHRRLDPKWCKWEIQVNTEKDNFQIVLQGIPAVYDSSESGLAKTYNNAELMVTSPAGCKTRVFSGMFHVHPLSQRKLVSVEINWDPKTQGRSPVNLRILLPVAGHCSRDMLSFHGNCHAVSPVRETVTLAMSNIKGDAQLASFISMSQVNDFVAANSAKLNEYPYRRILDLSEPVRLGMFYSATDARILSVVRNESGGCLLQAVERPEEMLVTVRVTGACGSLRVDESGRAVMEFGDCRRPMLALMSFPETASSVSAVTECGNDLVRQAIELDYQIFKLGVPKDDSPTVVVEDVVVVDTSPKIETEVDNAIEQNVPMTIGQIVPVTVEQNVPVTIEQNVPVAIIVCLFIIALATTPFGIMFCLRHFGHKVPNCSISFISTGDVKEPLLVPLNTQS